MSVKQSFRGVTLVLIVLCASFMCHASPATDRCYAESCTQVTGRFTKGYFDTLLEYFQTGLDVLLGRVGNKGWARGSSGSSRVSYWKYQLLRVYTRIDEHVDEIENLMDEADGLQFWTKPKFNHTTDIAVPPDLVDDIKEYLTERGIEFTVLIRDLQKTISSHNPKMSKEQRMELRGNRGHDMTWRRYHRYGDMLRYMQHLTTTYPDLVEILTIGQSSRGLPLKVAKVSTGSHLGKDGKPKPALWIDGGMHAREWISPAVAMYTLKQLVENFKVNRRIVEAADWYILPVVNPDGYEYTHTTDRLWRKTLSNHDDSEEKFSRFLWPDSCEGVDLNRNWDFHWGEKGASDDPCHETYAGPRPFSEPESRAIADFIMDRKERIKLYLTLHSYSQMWLVPWGYTYKKPSDFDDMMNMGKKAVEAISKVSGVKYELGPSPKLMYPTSGGSDDWAKGVAGIKYAYTVELRDKGDYGFLLPASEIVPTGKEAFAAIKALARAIACKV